MSFICNIYSRDSFLSLKGVSSVLPHVLMLHVLPSSTVAPFRNSIFSCPRFFFLYIPPSLPHHWKSENKQIRPNRKDLQCFGNIVRNLRHLARSRRSRVASLVGAPQVWRSLGIVLVRRRCVDSSRTAFRRVDSLACGPSLARVVGQRRRFCPPRVWFDGGGGVFGWTRLDPQAPAQSRVVGRILCGLSDGCQRRELGSTRILLRSLQARSSAFGYGRL